MARATVIADGLYFGEGPRWHDDRLWFSDFYDHAVKSMDPAGNVRTEPQIDEQPRGLGGLPVGRLPALPVPPVARAWPSTRWTFPTTARG